MFNDSELVKVNPTSIVFDNINRMLYEFAVSFVSCWNTELNTVHFFYYFFISVSDSYVADVEAYVLFYRLVEYLRLSCKKGG